jgi:hypothetical protein
MKTQLTFIHQVTMSIALMIVIGVCGLVPPSYAQKESRAGSISPPKFQSNLTVPLPARSPLRGLVDLSKPKIPSAPPQAVNEIKNPGFDHALRSWTISAKRGAGHVPPGLERDLLDAHNRVIYLRTAEGQTSSLQQGLRFFNPVTGRITIRSRMMRQKLSAQGRSGIELRVSYFDGTQDYLETFLAVSGHDPSGRWVSKASDFFPKKAVRRLELIVKSDGEAAVYFDDVMVLLQPS